MGKNLSFGPVVPHTHQIHSHHQHNNLSSVWHSLSSSDSSSAETSPLHDRTEHSSTAEQQIVQHLTYDCFLDVTCEEEEDNEEHFPTAPVDDDIGWMNQYQIDTYASMKIHNHMIYTLTLAYTAWISYTSLQNMHQHLSTWTSVTSLTFMI